MIASIVDVRNVGTTGVTIKNIKVDGELITSLPVGAGHVSGIVFGETGGIINNVTVEDTTFTANQNSAIYANLSSLDIGGANFSGNHAYAYEGAAMVLRGSQCLLSDDIFTNQVGDSVISLDPDNQTPAFLEVDSTIVSQGNLNFNSQSPSPDIRMPNADVNFADLSLSGEQTALCSSETSACMSDQE